jgi:hypothetical protein
MKKNTIINLKFEHVLLTLWWIGLILVLYVYVNKIINTNQNQNQNQTQKTIETFTPKIRSWYHPHMRNLRIHYESFINQYSVDSFIKILKRFGIY